MSLVRIHYPVKNVIRIISNCENNTTNDIGSSKK